MFLWASKNLHPDNIAYFKADFTRIGNIVHEMISYCKDQTWDLQTRGRHAIRWFSRETLKRHMLCNKWQSLQMFDNCLTTAWWLPDNCLTMAWQPFGNCLMTTLPEHVRNDSAQNWRQQTRQTDNDKNCVGLWGCAADGQPKNENSTWERNSPNCKPRRQAGGQAGGQAGVLKTRAEIM